MTRDKEKQKEYLKKYYQEHKEKHNEYLKKYRQKHKEEYKEKQKEYTRKYDQEHKEEINLNKRIKNNKSRTTANNHKQLWSYNDYLNLENYLKQGKSHSEISILMGRTICSINSAIFRLKTKGNPYIKK